jgi:hypothetical protein
LHVLDTAHTTGSIPPFQERFILWEVVFRNDIPDVFELNTANAAAMNVFPSLMLNPSQDYHHLKDRRAAIEHNSYKGLRAPSSRVRGTGNMVVLFEDQSGNVQSITPSEVEFRLITSGLPSVAFTNHAVDLLDFTAGEVRLVTPVATTGTRGASRPYQHWTRVEFNH